MSISQRRRPRLPGEARAWFKAQIEAEAETVARRIKERGLALHTSFAKPTTRWWLSNGDSVAGEVAKLVIARADVVGVGDALFANLRPQTFRYLEPVKRALK